MTNIDLQNATQKTRFRLSNRIPLSMAMNSDTVFAP